MSTVAPNNFRTFSRVFLQGSLALQQGPGIERELEGPDWINSEIRRLSVELPVAIGALALLSVPAAVSAGVLSARLRESPLYPTDREGIQLLKLRTISTVRAALMDKNEGTRVAGNPAICNFIRKLSIDEYPQLFDVVFRRKHHRTGVRTNQMTLYGIRGLDQRDHELFKQAAPELYEEVQDLRATHGLKPALSGPDSAWRKGKQHSLSVPGRVMSLLLQRNHILHETRQSELAGYAQVGRIVTGRAEWPVPAPVWRDFEALTQLSRETATDFFRPSLCAVPATSTVA